MLAHASVQPQAITHTDTYFLSHTQGGELQPVTVENPEAVTVMKLPTPQLGDLPTK